MSLFKAIAGAKSLTPLDFCIAVFVITYQNTQQCFNTERNSSWDNTDGLFTTQFGGIMGALQLEFVLTAIRTLLQFVVSI